MNDLDQALSLLASGKLVAIPTETVYGLAADATNDIAIQKIFAAKERPADHPLIVHIADINALTEWAVHIPESAYQLGRIYWPGPLTLILQKAPSVSDLLTGGQETIGLRIPQHPLTLELLRRFGKGLAAPSANRFGQLSPTTAAHVRESLGDRVDYILDGGPCDIGIESTILDLSQIHPVLLRPGIISKEEIEQALQQPVLAKTEHSPRVSGSHASHYAPRTPTYLIAKHDLLTLDISQKKIGIVCFHTLNKPNAVIQQLPNDAKHYAHALYASLHKLDTLNLDMIYIEQVPASVAWLAVQDRIERASRK